jgi:hypothetical protein
VEGEARTWTGRREPNTSLAWTVIGIGAGLLAVAVYQVLYWDATMNLWYLALLVAGMVAYAAITFTSYVEMEVDLGEEELTYTKREWSVGRVVREVRSTLERSRLAKVVERNAGLGVRVVRFEDADGRRLLVLPEFLDMKEHDAMIAAIIAWGDQEPPSPSSTGSEETPLPDSR